MDPRLSLGTNGLRIAALEINKFKSKVGGLAFLGQFMWKHQRVGKLNTNHWTCGIIKIKY